MARAKSKRTAEGIALAALLQQASAGPETVLRDVICMLYNQLIPIAWALAFLMFVYGGAKYAYSADDPGGRKQAKSVAVNALIGLIIVGVSRALIMMVNGGSNPCP